MGNNFAGWLNGLLMEAGWSNSEFARRIEVVPSTVSMWLSGQKVPSPANCISIAKELKLPPEQVLRRAGFIPDVAPEAESEEELLYIFRQLDEKTQEMIVSMIKGLIKGKSAKNDKL